MPNRPATALTQMLRFRLASVGLEQAGLISRARAAASVPAQVRKSLAEKSSPIASRR